MFVKDLESLKYSELQKLAKNAGIKANQKVERLLKALQNHYMETEDGHENVYDISNETQENGSDSEVVNNTFTCNLLKGKNLAQKKTSDVMKKNSQALTSPAPGKKTANQSVSTPLDETDSKCTKKRRRTFELSEPTLSAQSTPTLVDSFLEKRSSRQNTSDINGSSDEQVGPAKKRVRKNTYNAEEIALADNNDNSSPGTKALIEEIDANLPSVERKKRLLEALDKKIKTKAPSSPAKSISAQPSQIPRFMAFLANKKAETQKPATPGNKDWTKIHKKEFSKFDSLDVYLEKKQQRMEKLSGSAKRRTNFGITLRKGPKIVKPVSAAATKLLEPVKVFVPTVTTTKNLSFNFNKTPVTLSTKTPSLQRSSNKTILQTPKTVEPAISAKKPAITGNKNNVFVFTGNNTSVAASSHKKVFDLKASLSKPLSWKPHSGKLQPLDFNKSHTSTIPVASHPEKPIVERPTRQAMADKFRQVNAKDVRRADQLNRRNNQKYIDMMKRRGLLA